MEGLIIWIVILVGSALYSGVKKLAERAKQRTMHGANQHAQMRNVQQQRRQRQHRQQQQGYQLQYQQQYQQPYVPQQPYYPQSEPYVPQRQPYTPQPMPEEGQRVTTAQAQRPVQAAKSRLTLDLHDKDQLKRAIILGDILQPKF